ncbi:iron-containing alcohol dehydrogenase [Roseovarius salinarum]|uniref:iron-containing alcohol dehydrogenase n=1 Tax=Roseovarius salinarum TaxID=1981892 RepID=UPI0038CDB283
MPPFEFRAPARLVFGRGEASRAAALGRALGRRVLLVQGGGRARTDWLGDALAAEGCEIIRVTCPHEPDVPALEAALEATRAAQPQAVVAIGGGAVIDMAKALAALLPAPGGLHDHLEVVGAGKPLRADPLPMLALPTTAGTGAEVTRNAVLGVPEARRKVSLRDARVVPDIALVDPALTDGAPRAVTLASGLDAVTQVIEPYVCTRPNPMTDALCRAAIPEGLTALKALMSGEDAASRDRMAWVSLCGGLALSNAGLGAVHGLAGVIGGVTDAPHGAICGALLPHVLRMNAARVDDAGRRARLDAVLGLIAGTWGAENGDAGLDALALWSRDNGLAGLSEMGVTPRMHETLAEGAKAASSMKPNPADLGTADLTEILSAAA